MVERTSTYYFVESLLNKENLHYKMKKYPHNYTSSI